MLEHERGNLGWVHEIEAWVRVNLPFLHSPIVQWKTWHTQCSLSFGLLTVLCYLVISSDQTSLLEFLHILTTNHKLVFASVNNEPNFIAGLCHWLLVMGTHKSLAVSENNSPSLGKKSEGKQLSGHISDKSFFQSLKTGKKHLLDL